MSEKCMDWPPKLDQYFVNGGFERVAVRRNRMGDRTVCLSFPDRDKFAVGQGTWVDING